MQTNEEGEGGGDTYYRKRAVKLAANVGRVRRQVGERCACQDYSTPLWQGTNGLTRPRETGKGSLVYRAECVDFFWALFRHRGGPSRHALRKPTFLLATKEISLKAGGSSRCTVETKKGTPGPHDGSIVGIRCPAEILLLGPSMIW